MKKIIAVLAALLLCGCVFAAEYTTEDGSVKLNAKTISMNKKAVNAKENVSLYVKDDASELSVKSSDMKLVYGGNNVKGIEKLKQAVIKGEVAMVYKLGDDVYKVWCDSSFYENNIMTLAGNVRIEYTSKESSMTAEGERATINLSKKIGEDEQLFSIEGDSKRAKITVPAAGVGLK